MIPDSPKRVLVCGDRNWTDATLVFDVLNSYWPSVIIMGGAKGADNLGGRWAMEHSVKLEVYPAEWRIYGKGAGPVRNQRMLDEGRPDLVVAFHSDLAQSKGTKDMVNRSHRAGIPVRIVRGKGEEG
jgi:hypothetical protein